MKGWDIICLGSDNDGVVNAFDSYDDSSALDRFKTDIQDYLESYIVHVA